MEEFLKNRKFEIEQQLVVMLVGGDDSFKIQSRKKYILNHIDSCMFDEVLFQNIVKAAQKLLTNGYPITLDYFLSKAKKLKTLKLLEEAVTLQELNEEYITAANCDYYIKLLHELYFDEQFSKTSSYENFKRLENLKRKVELKNNVVKIAHKANELISDYFDNWEKAILSGWNSLDKRVGAFLGGDFGIIAGAPGMGKALRLDAKILTQKGWVKNRDLKVGDKIIAFNGNETVVKGIYPQGPTSNYKVYFSDGRCIETCGEHLWEVNFNRWKKPKILTTKEIKRRLDLNSYKNKLSIPLFHGDYGQNCNFVIPPYLLGILLGDGCLTKSITYFKPDDFIFDKIKKLLPDSVDIHRNKGNEVSITNFQEGRDYLKENNLQVSAYTKHIPTEYMHASRKQRLELVQGLMDSDGGVDKNGAIEFSSSSKQLAYDVQQLLWSLGYKCRIIERIPKLNGKEYAANYRLYPSGNNESELFTLPRKKQRIKKRKNKPLVIKKIEEAGHSETQCIEVEDSRKLYITDDYIVTHNTCTMLNIIQQMDKRGTKVLLFSLEMKLPQLQNRLISAKTQIPSSKFRLFNMTGDEIKRYEAYSDSEELKKSNIVICDDFEMTLNDIESAIQRTAPDIVFVDYLGLIKSTIKGSEYEQLNDISRGLKILAGQLNIPIFALHQLSRDIAKRENKEPIMADLRGSGHLEQDADFVFFVHRPAYFEPKLNPRELKFIIGKSRHTGGNKYFTLAYDAKTQTITDLDKTEPHLQHSIDFT